MVGRHQFEKRSPIKRLAFTELYLREVFGQSNLVETRGREKRQNLSNSLKKTRRQNKKPCGGTTTGKHVKPCCLFESAQHNPPKPKGRRAEKNKWRAIQERIQNDIVAKIANKPTCKSRQNETADAVAERIQTSATLTEIQKRPCKAAKLSKAPKSVKLLEIPLYPPKKSAAQKIGTKRPKLPGKKHNL